MVRKCKMHVLLHALRCSLCHHVVREMPSSFGVTGLAWLSGTRVPFERPTARLCRSLGSACHFSALLPRISHKIIRVVDPRHCVCLLSTYDFHLELLHQIFDSINHASRTNEQGFGDYLLISSCKPFPCTSLPQPTWPKEPARSANKLNHAKSCHTSSKPCVHPSCLPNKQKCLLSILTGCKMYTE